MSLFDDQPVDKIPLVAVEIPLHTEVGQQGSRQGFACSAIPELPGSQRLSIDLHNSKTTV
jgi:hypothetical protein